MALLTQNLKNEGMNYDICTICNATGVFWVSKEAENSNKARHFSLMRYFSPKPEKTSKNCQKMSIFSSFFEFFQDFQLLAGK